MYSYHLFGLPVASEIELLPLPVTTPSQPPAEIHVRLGKLSQRGLENPDIKGLFVQWKAKQVWLHIPPIGYFLIEEGTKITVKPIKTLDALSVSQAILTNCFPILLIQRGLFLFKASVIKNNEQVFALFGSSGAGKSTFAAALSQRGYQVLADEFCIINTNNEAIPSIPFLKLWQDTMAALQIDAAFTNVRPGLKYYYYPLSMQYYPQPLAIQAGIFLEDNHTSIYACHPITGLQKITTLKKALYQPDYTAVQDIDGQYPLRLANVAKTMSLYSLTRPHEGFFMEEGMTWIEKCLAHEVDNVLEF